jgi:membrane-associated phospholipid phosphatase
VANPNSVDLQLYRLDLDWFGVEPALWLDSRATPFWTEWFALFYYSYFYLLAAHIAPILYTRAGEGYLARFGTGMTVVATIGHTLYILVPGYGPFRALADQFQHPLEGGLFWSLVLETVAAGGAEKDIFPSMHTAFPTFIALFSFYHRKQVPFRYTWAPVAFIVVNIIGATMYLRWHYVIDVVAGLALASFAFAVSVYLVRFEQRTRSQRGLSPVWPSWR